MSVLNGLVRKDAKVDWMNVQNKKSAKKLNTLVSMLTNPSWGLNDNTYLALHLYHEFLATTVLGFLVFTNKI